MALSGLDIYKLLPKTNCRDCGFVTCLAFAMQLAKKAVSLEKCPYLDNQARSILEASGQPPIKLVSIGIGANILDVGNETVLFRHEEKFHHPAGIGLVLDDTLSQIQIKEQLAGINKLVFERVGQTLGVNLVAINQSGTKDDFASAVKTVSENTELGLVLISKDAGSLAEPLRLTKGKKPLIYCKNNSDFVKTCELAKEFDASIVISQNTLEETAASTIQANTQGVTGIVILSAKKALAENIWELTQIRRLALKKSNRSLGYPVLTIIDKSDHYTEAMEAATYIAKYASIILLKGFRPWEILPLLTLRQNLYTDPQKPLQIEPKLYSILDAKENAPVLITTNFSLSYYTVLAEVESSKVPAHILAVDTEGMSVLTAWAAEKFTPDKINEAISKLEIEKTVSHKKVIIPGYVAGISGDLEDVSGFEVIVGPKEAAGIPTFLKNL
jgi:acetyl-CoA decarbonylase/synthase complex subunit gamma